MKNFFENKSVENLINGTIESLRSLAEANAVVGDAIVLGDGSVVVPISKISVGYVVGGGEYLDVARKKKLENYPLAGGSGGGASITPIGFLTSNQSGIDFISVADTSGMDAIMKLVNLAIDRMKDKTEQKDSEFDEV